MDKLGILGLIVMIGTFLTLSIIFFGSMALENMPHEYPEDHTKLNISNFTTTIRLEISTDQYGNNYKETYKYWTYADLYNWSSTENYTVQIKAYDSQGNYLENISKNCTLSSLNYNTDTSGRDIEYYYYSDEPIDYKYTIFEIYDSHGLCYNQTAEFNTSDITTINKINYIAGEIW